MNWSDWKSMHAQAQYTGSTRRFIQGFSLIELLCSIAIIAILAGLFLGPASRALRRARLLKMEMEAPAHLERLTDGMRRFAAAQTSYNCPDLQTFLAQARPGAPTERWAKAHMVEFIPFHARTPNDRIVLTLQIPSSTRNHVLGYNLSKGELTTYPE